jgi:hypothetical protein
MALHWPHNCKLQVRDAHHLQQILNWAHVNCGDTSYQHWNSHYAHPWLTMYFCDAQFKTAFELAFL